MYHLFLVKFEKMEIYTPEGFIGEHEGESPSVLQWIPSKKGQAIINLIQTEHVNSAKGLSKAWSYKDRTFAKIVRQRSCIKEVGKNVIRHIYFPQSNIIVHHSVYFMNYEKFNIIWIQFILPTFCIN